MLRSFIIFFSSVSALLFCFSCSKGDDYITPPFVIISNPFQNQIFGYGDTIFIKASISHFREIENIKISLLNKAFSPVLPVLNYSVNVNDYQINTYFVLEDINLDEGEYFIQIKVSDKQSSWNEWADIRIAEVARELKSVIAVVAKTDIINAFEVFETPLNGNSSKLYDFSGDHLGSEVNSKYNIHFTVGRIYNGLIAWDMDKKIPGWSIPAIVDPPQEWFYSLYADDKEVFVSTRDGYVIGYDRFGKVSFRSLQFQNGKFTHFVRHQNTLIAVFEPFNSHLQELVVFNYPGGTVQRRLQISGNVKHLSVYNSGSILVFSDQATKLSVFEFTIENSTLVKLKDFAFENCDIVIGSGKDHYFISSGNEIWWYRPETGSATIYTTVQEPGSMAFDELNNQLLVVTGSTISYHRLPFSQSLGNIEMPGRVVGIKLRYNR
jgi:hypothetical protein